MPKTKYVVTVVTAFTVKEPISRNELAAIRRQVKDGVEMDILDSINHVDGITVKKRTVTIEEE